MSKLSHIEDVERRAQQEQEREAQVSVPESASRPIPSDEPDRAEAPSAQEDMTAEQEEEFHGLDTIQPMGGGHKALIVIALVVVAVAILYIVNSWIHFI